MRSIHHDNAANSTTFTDCCGTAIGEERYCPSCGEEIEGWREDCHPQEIRNNRFRIAFSKSKHMLSSW